MATINERIKKRRKELNKTLLELAEYVGVKEATMQRYESGEIKSIPYDNIVKISEYLNCTPQYLMGWSDDITPELSLSEQEKAMVKAYRSHPEVQNYVNKLLDLPAVSNGGFDVAEDAAKTVNAISAAVTQSRCKKNTK